MQNKDNLTIQKSVETALESSGIVGKDMMSLSEEELRELAGAGNDMDPEITPTAVLASITTALGSAVASYCASAKYKC